MAGNQSTGLSGSNTSTTEKSLDYLFNEYDSETEDTNKIDGKKAYLGVKNLLQVDQEGYFYYKSAENFASLDEQTKKITLYDTWGVSGGGAGSSQGQFFPFDSANSITGATAGDNNSLNHFFGLHMSTQFVQKNGGYTEEDETQPITFEFSGDDDVWVFIDGVLVADLGGIHNAASVEINFATGEIKINGGEGSGDDSDNKTGASTTTLYKAYEAANATTNTTWATEENNNTDKTTFADDTYHTLDFFYLERGGGESNMNLRFNLKEVPPSYIVKVDQDGKPLSNVGFNLFVGHETAGTPATESNPIASGTTNSDGELLLTYAENTDNNRAGRMVSLADLYTTYENDTNVMDEGRLPLTLVEDSTLNDQGYRILGSPIYLYVEETDQGYVLVADDNTLWTQGVYPMSTVITTADRTVHSVTGDTSNEKKEGTLGDGTMFAVILKWVGKQDPTDETIRDQENWIPVHGSSSDGWTIEDDDFKDVGKDQEKYIEKLLEVTAKIENTKNAVPKFSASLEGGWKAEISDLPGDITTYYSMVDKTDIGKVRYAIGYYYTSAPTIEAAANDTNGQYETWRVDDTELSRDFGVKINVPNIKNYLIAQRLDEQGNPVNDATFTLYKVNTDCDAELNSDGTVKVKNDSSTTPATDTTKNRTKGVSPGNGQDPSRFTMQGAAYFSGLKIGTYYLVETSAPTGYLPNTKPVKVIVDDKGVHADAGDTTVKDGISTAVSVGSLVETMAQFGSAGEVDRTLTDIIAQKQIGDEGDNNSLTWKEDNTKVELQYDSKAPLEYVLSKGSSGTSPIGFVSSSGWTWATIKQNYAAGEKDLKKDISDMDLTNLFSGSTTVRVASQGKGDLKVENNVIVPTGEDNTDKFNYTLNFTYQNKIDANVDLNTDPLAGTFSYVISETNGGTKTTKETGTLTITQANGTYSISTITVNTDSDSTPNSQYFNQTDGTTFTLADGESLTIQGLPTGTSYTVTEKKNDVYSTTVAATSTKDNTPTTTPPYTAEGTIAKHEDIHTVTYTNTRSPFTIGKAVDKPRTTVGNTLTYTITVMNTSKEKLTDITVTDTLTSNSTGKVTFTNLPSEVKVNDDGTVTISSLEAGKSITITAIYTTVTTDVGKVTNTATGKVDKDGTKIEVTTPPVTTTVTDPPTPVNPVNPTDPNKPVTPPDSLNTEDHFAYIIGYPEDYYTGLPTDDQTKKPVKPEGNITRAEVATIFFRLLTDDVRNTYWSQTCDYSDVTIDKWYNNAICTLSNFGILKGYEDGTFRPDGNITRAEFATIAVRFFEVEYNGKDLFPDINGHWAQDYINQAGFAGLVEGYPDGTFGPEKLITRAEAVTIVNRTIDRHPDKEHLLDDMLVWPDNMDTTKWYYADMQEATNSHEYTMHTKTAETESQTKYEIWQKILPVRDWEAFEKAWADANAAPNPGEVVQ